MRAEAPNRGVRDKSGAATVAQHNVLGALWFNSTLIASNRGSSAASGWAKTAGPAPHIDRGAADRNIYCVNWIYAHVINIVAVCVLCAVLMPCRSVPDVGASMLRHWALGSRGIGVNRAGGNDVSFNYHARIPGTGRCARAPAIRYFHCACETARMFDVRRERWRWIVIRCARYCNVLGWVLKTCAEPWCSGSAGRWECEGVKWRRRRDAGMWYWLGWVGDLRLKVDTRFVIKHQWEWSNSNYYLVLW